MSIFSISSVRYDFGQNQQYRPVQPIIGRNLLPMTKAENIGRLLMLLAILSAARRAISESDCV